MRKTKKPTSVKKSAFLVTQELLGAGSTASSRAGLLGVATATHGTQADNNQRDCNDLLHDQILRTKGNRSQSQMNIIQNSNALSRYLGGEGGVLFSTGGVLFSAVLSGAFSGTLSGDLSGVITRVGIFFSSTLLAPAVVSGWVAVLAGSDVVLKVPLFTVVLGFFG
jgi:hypothetical protein